MKYQQEYKRSVTDNMEFCRSDAAKMRERLEASTAHYHGFTVHTLYMPKLYRPQDLELLTSAAETTYRILEKVTNEYLRSAEYRRLFGFEPRLEELILHKPPYSCTIPIARLDVFYDPDAMDFKFCEFNTDGSSGMNEDRELNNVFAGSETFKSFAAKHTLRRFELFDSWVSEFINIYGTTPGAVEKPHIAIVDFMSSASNEEFEEFVRAFARAGYECEICDIYKLRYENSMLISPSGKKIDAVYRRAVTGDIMRHYDEVRPLIDAYLNDDTVVIGSFRTQVAHNKLVFMILHSDMTKAILTDEENDFIARRIPSTYMLTHDNIHKYNVIEDRLNWIVKPADSYASKGVFAGIEAKDTEEWLAFLSKHMDTGYLLQRYVTPYESENIDLLWDQNAELQGIANITGMFVYGGRLQGLYSRASKTGVISTQYSEMTLPTIIVED